jgi:FkbM family methyltransferase
MTWRLGSACRGTTKGESGARVLRALGRGARWGRRAGLGAVLAAVRDFVDAGLARLGRPPLRVDFEGLRLYGYFRHRSFLHDLIAESYEPLARALFLDALRPDCVVVDGGAHIGLYSLLAARMLPKGTRIFAFEPDPYNRRAFAVNRAVNGCEHVVLSPRALADREGEAIFHVNRGTIGSSLMARRWWDLGGAWDVRVETTTLDHELHPFEGGQFVVKLDVEGAEPLVLRGMRRLVRRARSVTLMVELNPEALTASGEGGRSGGQRLLDDLDELGFDVHFVDEGRRALVSRREIDARWKGNVWCVREQARPSR